MKKQTKGKDAKKRTKDVLVKVSPDESLVFSVRMTFREMERIEKCASLADRSKNSFIVDSALEHCDMIESPHNEPSDCPKLVRLGRYFRKDNNLKHN